MASRPSLEYDYLFKIVLVGDAAVGKTNLLACYTSQVQWELRLGTIIINTMQYDMILVLEVGGKYSGNTSCIHHRTSGMPFVQSPLGHDPSPQTTIS